MAILIPPQPRETDRLYRIEATYSRDNLSSISYSIGSRERADKKLREMIENILLSTNPKTMDLGKEQITGKITQITNVGVTMSEDEI